jgi:hypothetical protein
MALILGTDLDDCVLETARSIIAKIKQDCGININYDDICSYNLEDHISKEYHSKIQEIVYSVLQHTDSIEVVSSSILVLNWITLLTKKVYVVSHRPSSVYDHTKQVLENIGLSRFELIFTHEDNVCDYLHKYRVINDYGINVFIEDKPETIMDLFNFTSCEILVFNRPWNKSIKENSRITVCNSWADIRDLTLMKMVGE